MFRFLQKLFATTWLALLTAAAVESHRPASLEGVQGLDGGAKASGPDLLDRIEQSIWRRNAPLEITEAEINRYLATTIAGEQRGFSAGRVRFERVALSFRPGTCRLWLCWSFRGHPSTASIDFSIRRENRDFIIEPRQGRFGRLPVIRGALAALLPGLHSLRGVLDDEIHGVFQMNQIAFADHKLVLDPRFEPEK